MGPQGQQQELSKTPQVRFPKFYVYIIARMNERMYVILFWIWHLESATQSLFHASLRFVM